MDHLLYRMIRDIYIKSNRRRADVLVVEYSDYVLTVNNNCFCKFNIICASRVVCEWRSSEDGDDDFTGKTNEEQRNSFWTEEGRWSRIGEKSQDQDNEHKDDDDDDYVKYDGRDIHIDADVHIVVDHICVDDHVCDNNDRH